MNRVLLLVCFALLSCLKCFASDSLILIQHDKAGPNLPTADYIHPGWILWGDEEPEGSLNQLQSLGTGIDWVGDLRNLSFKNSSGSWLATNFGALGEQGYLAAREKLLGDIPTHVITNSRGVVSYATLLLGLSSSSNVVEPLPFTKNVPQDGLIVYEAIDWNDAFDIVKASKGRSLIIEYPVPQGQTWSRYWLKGRAWPEGIPLDSDTRVPGLIHARNALKMLIYPTKLGWMSDNTGAWGGANRWLEHGQQVSPLIHISLFFFAVVVTAISLSLAANEDSGRPYAILLNLLVLSPAILTLSGNLSRWAGLNNWILWMVVAALALGALSYSTQWMIARRLPEVHPIFATCVVGLLTMSLLNPLWSDMSGVFRSIQSDVPDEALGAWIGYLAGTCIFIRDGSSKRSWLSRSIAIAAVLISSLADVWWVRSHPSVIAVPAVSLIVSEGLIQWPLVAMCALLPTSWIPLIRNGVSWSPNGLVMRAQDWEALSLRHYVFFIASPAFIGTSLTVFFMFLYGNRFIAYRLNKLLKTDSRRKAFLWVAVSCVALGIAEPILLRASLTLALGAGLMLLLDALRSPEPFLKPLH